MLLWLDPDEVLCLPKVSRGFTVRCERGTAWLTQCGDPSDCVLTAQGMHSVRGRGKVTVWASGRCALRLEAPPHGRTLGLRWSIFLAAARTPPG